MSESATATTLEESVVHYLSAPWREWTETYVVANSIGLRGQTPKVRRALRKLEAAGRVVSRDSWRHNMLEWKLAPIAAAEPTP